MLVVKIDGLLNCLVTDYIAMGEVLGNNARARLFLLCNLIGIALIVRGIVAVIRVGRCRGNLDLSRAELGVVEEEGSLCGSFLLESDSCALGGFAGWCEIELGDLTTEGEEVLDLLLAGLQADVLNVDGGCHIV